MKRVDAIRSILLAAVLAIAAAPRLSAVEPFYIDLLRDGRHAFDRGDYSVAARNFRLACFGMLDEPKELGECLARLALAQDKAGDMTGFRETFGRLIEIEERFQGYSQSSLPPETRALLEQRMAALIPAATLAASPQALRGSTGRKPEAQATKPRSDKPQPIERSSSTTTAPAPARPAAPAPAPAAQETQPPVSGAAPDRASPTAPADADRKKQERARKLLAETGTARELREAFQLSREVADAHPESREAQQLAGEAAYRISRWSDAADYLGRAGGPGDDQPELLFYLAVSLFESGNAQGAAAPLRRALPNLQRTPYVDAYAKKILGP
jgi:tetratricopeptide (TPR) repeat protein